MHKLQRILVHLLPIKMDRDHSQQSSISCLPSFFLLPLILMLPICRLMHLHRTPLLHGLVFFGKPILGGKRKSLKEEFTMTTTPLESMKMESSESQRTPVILNIYDLTSVNRFSCWAGLGAFHSGVEVHGEEYWFGASNHRSYGVFAVEPRKWPDFKFRKSIIIGTTSYCGVQVGVLMEALAREYSGLSYSLFSKNCNHFSNDVCLRLTGKSIPKWVNRLANIASHCCCI